jgi:saccharopine dehydrogenase (NADP+, L-glutamate forming)
VPAPEVDANPLRYCITWNPRNVVMSGEAGAQYLVDGKIKIVPWHGVFNHSWPVEVDGVGAMEAYPNRDSLSYLSVFHLERCRTMIRGTLRYPGWSETWQQIVRLGLPLEQVRIPDLPQRSMAEIVEMFLPRAVSGTRLEGRVANFLGISATGRIMENLRWLGLFDTAPCGIDGETPADAMNHLLRQRLRLPEEGRDMVAIVHEIEARYPDDDGRRERIVSTFKHFGTPGGVTAMAKAVGLPAAIAAKLVLTGELPLMGSHIPTHERVYGPVMRELESEGMRFEERCEALS